MVPGIFPHHLGDRSLGQHYSNSDPVSNLVQSTFGGNVDMTGADHAPDQSEDKVAYQSLLHTDLTCTRIASLCKQQTVL